LTLGTPSFLLAEERGRYLFNDGSGVDSTSFIVNINRNNLSILEKESLYNIFTLRQTHFPSGESIKVVVLPQDHDSTRDMVFNIFEYPNIHTFFKNIIDRNQRTHNLFFADDERQVIEMVSKSDSYIGYVNGYFVINETSVKRLYIDTSNPLDKILN
jgi:ABC-type phosphate transport system substrate-binding protein